MILRNTYKVYISIFVLNLVLSDGVALAQTPERFANIDPKYDRNGNGKLDAGPELEVYLIHQRNPVLSMFDEDLNGVLSEAETAKMNEAACSELSFDLQDANDYLGDHPDGITVAAPEPSPEPRTEPADTLVSNGFFIRNAYSPISVLSEIPRRDANSLRTVTPATLSYTRDNRAGSDQLSISGAVSGFRRWSYRGDKKPLPNLEAAALSGGIVFDRTISSAEDANEANSLALRVDSDAVFQGWPLFDTHFVTASTAFTTDFDFDTAIVSGTLRWQPVHNAFAIGVASEFDLGSLPLAFRWQPSVEVEYQHIADDGGQEQLQDADDFLFVGPLITAQLFFDFEPLNGAFLNVDYRFMADTLGNTSSFDFLEVSANFPLDTENHFLLNFRFREGRLPTTRQEVDDFLIGVGVRF